jgi:hypothetical protein
MVDVAQANRSFRLGVDKLSLEAKDRESLDAATLSLKVLTRGDLHTMSIA